MGRWLGDHLGVGRVLLTQGWPYRLLLSTRVQDLVEDRIGKERRIFSANTR